MGGRTFRVMGGGVHAAPARVAFNPEVARAQADAIFASSRPAHEKRVMLLAVAAGATFDLSQLERHAHAPMPGLAIGREVRAAAAPSMRPLSATHSPMPGLTIGRTPELRANAARRHGPTGHYFMPGLRIGTPS